MKTKSVGGLGSIPAIRPCPSLRLIRRAREVGLLGMLESAVQTGVHRLHVRKDQQSERREPHRQAHGRRCAWFISKAGVTSSTFKTVPDQPVTSFELTLPEGPYSALTALGNLCTVKKLTMPTELVGQNGAEIEQSTKIAVTGCPKTQHVKHKRRKKHASKKHAKKK
jgi:hypothetical protein